MKLRILLAFLLLLLFLSLPQIIKIKKINCRSQFGQCSDNLQKDVIKVEGQTLFMAKRALNNLLSKNFQINNFSIRYKFPDALEINVIEKKVLFGLKMPDENLVFLVDREGIIVYQAEKTNLPLIEIEKKSLTVGQKVSDEELFALKILEDMFHLYDATSGKIQVGSLVIKGNNLATGIFPLSGDEKVLVGAFRLINDQLNSPDQNSRIDRQVNNLVIDLRFKNPIIR